MNNTNNEVINNFIIEMTLIDPIEKIIAKINGGEIRDCDIKWLDANLDKYIQFAAKTFGFSLAERGGLYETYKFWNSHVKEYYLSRFTNLCNYFKSFKN